jgi:hypothetical protein
VDCPSRPPALWRSHNGRRGMALAAAPDFSAPYPLPRPRGPSLRLTQRGHPSRSPAAAVAACRRVRRFTGLDHRPRGEQRSGESTIAAFSSLWRPRHGEGATAPAAAPGLSAPSLARLRGAPRSILTTADGGFSRQSRHMRCFRMPGLSLVSDHNARPERGAPARARALLRCCRVRRDHSVRRQSSLVIVVTAERAAQ